MTASGVRGDWGGLSASDGKIFTKVEARESQIYRQNAPEFTK